MKSKIRVQPAAVIATLALFVALGGTSYAASSSINGSQLTNHSVAGKKLQNHTVTGTQVKVSTFPKVPSAHRADLATHATTAGTAGTISGTILGSQVSGAVANATNATTAGTAGTAGALTGTILGSQVSGAVANATNATTAGALAGHTFAEININSSSAAGVTILSLGGLNLALRCSGGDTFFDATTATNDADYVMSGVANSNATNLTGKEGDFNVATTDTDSFGAPAQVTFSYAPSGSEVVTGTMAAYDNAGTCSVFGNAEESG
jgi:hypothetical protein